MAKSISAKSTARRLKSSSGGTFIQRSRSVPAEEKAAFHNVLGAGRSRVIREFFGLPESDEARIGDIIKAAISAGMQG